MTYFTKTETAQLLENGKPENHGKDHHPVARFYLPYGGVLMVTELHPKKPSLAYGLCDLDAQACKLTHFDLDNFATIASENDYDFKRDAKFKPKYPITVYLKAAKKRHTMSLMRQALDSLPENKA